MSQTFCPAPRVHHAPRYDHSYLADTLRAHPDRFVGCMLADPRPEGGGLAALEELAGTGLFRAVRFNPYLWPEGQRMDNQVCAFVCVVGGVPIAPSGLRSPSRP